VADLTVAAETCVALGATDHQFESYPGRDIALGALTVTRVLPVKGRRLVGPWCFLDRFGPLTFADPLPMDVGAHPHMGLQTVTWLLDGEVVHYDSLGSESLLRPGGVNVMTSGGAIAHAERTPTKNSGRLDGVQLWVALPDADRHGPALFQHVERVPVDEQRGGIVHVFAGSVGALTSSATHYSGIVGGDVQIHPGAELELPLERAYEYAVLVLHGDCGLEGQPLQERVLYYLGANRSVVSFTSRSGSRLLLVGGPPFPERILMWWNFVARTPREIADARTDWEERRRFGDVTGYAGPRLAAPSLLKFASPNPAS
jgi:redox-sensitive bicupin YhaK (pirin superfamily)